MADIAVVFHWPPSEMAAFSISELIEWHEMAEERGSRNE
ncbi:GpE family phage tail protein [uncultured Tolumonas sp.]|nr:GpE family phage tail protein [uncultured Tolumonas sp.]